MSDAGAAGETIPEWLSLDDGEELQWVGEPELASKANELVTGAMLLPFLGLGLVVMVPAYLQVKNTDYVATNQSLYAKSGILSTNIQSLELDKIQNTEYSQSFLEKQMGYGTVGFDTAGSSGVELEFEAISNAREVQENVRELAKQYRDGVGSGGEAGDASGGGHDALEDVADELQRTREALQNVEAAISEALSARRGNGTDGQTASGGASGAGQESTGRAEPVDDQPTSSDRDGAGQPITERTVDQDTGDGSEST